MLNSFKFCNISNIQLGKKVLFKLTFHKFFFYGILKMQNKNLIFNIADEEFTKKNKILNHLQNLLF